MKNKIKLFFISYHFYPDQSAGAIRSKFLINELLSQEKKLDIWLFCSHPNRYKKKFFKNHYKDIKESSTKRLHIKRIWTPYFGQNILSSVISYFFFFIQVFSRSIFIRPDIVFATTAKLFSGVLGSCIAKVNRSLFFLDIRDTFVDNYLYIFRDKKRIILLGIFAFLERFTIRSADSINIVSIGFKELLINYYQIALEYGNKITNYTNGIDNELYNKLSSIDRSKKLTNKFYKVIYLGNIGEGQSLFELIANLHKDLKTIESMKNNNIIFEIYGAGLELKKIQDLLNESNILGYQTSDVIKYCGLVKKENIGDLYKEANCLMLQLAGIKSIECVIPSKIFEYVSTDLPIIFGASGFSHDFIKKINATIPFKKFNSKSFYKAIIKSKTAKISMKDRSKFLKKYKINNIYKEYSSHILSL
tara:strand:+ start:1678 stop:2931 length:1254 start_codon:yes stop_codon:yes gene_type:complete